jgi:hypothetical protein
VSRYLAHGTTVMQSKRMEMMALVEDVVPFMSQSLAKSEDKMSSKNKMNGMCQSGSLETNNTKRMMPG